MLNIATVPPGDKGMAEEFPARGGECRFTDGTI